MAILDVETARDFKKQKITICRPFGKGHFCSVLVMLYSFCRNKVANPTIGLPLIAWDDIRLRASNQ
jgi:hypothetical protein